ncbi:pilus assembly protein PilP [Solemya velesiana gill symbiont]|nr:pilus assembly protein PilP [Solemya velesiana gill symbiont]
MSDLKKYVQEVKSRKAGHIEPLPEIKQVETYAFVGAGRDPFFLVEEEAQEGEIATGGVSPDTIRRKEELENYELDALRMVGILEQDEGRWALIQTREKTIYRVQVGNYMGKHHGQITRITETAADLTEIIPDGQGGYRERQASLALTE